MSEKSITHAMQTLLSWIESSGVTAEHINRALETGLFADVIQSGTITVVAEKIREECRRNVEAVMLEVFRQNVRMVAKILSPEDIIVTRPRKRYCGEDDACGQRRGKYQMAFWYREPGRFNYINEGRVIDSGLEQILFEYYSSHDQPPDLDYPMESDDLSRMAPWGYVWVREPIEVKCASGFTWVIDVFQMRKEDK